MYRRAQTHLNCPPRLQSGRSRTHLACRRSGKCPVALVRVDSTFIGAVSQPNFRRPHRPWASIARHSPTQICLRCLSHHNTGRSHDPLPTSLLKRNSAVTDRGARRTCSTAFGCLAQFWHLCIISISPLQTVSPPTSHSKNKPPRFRTCPRLSVAFGWLDVSVSSEMSLRSHLRSRLL